MLKDKDHIYLGENTTIYCGMIKGFTIDSAGNFKKRFSENNNSRLAKSHSSLLHKLIAIKHCR